MSSSAIFRAKSVSTFFNKRKNVFFRQSLAGSLPICNAFKSASSVAYKYSDSKLSAQMLKCFIHFPTRFLSSVRGVTDS